MGGWELEWGLGRGLLQCGHLRMVCGLGERACAIHHSLRLAGVQTAPEQHHSLGSGEEEGEQQWRHILLQAREGVGEQLHILEMEGEVGEQLRIPEMEGVAGEQLRILQMEGEEEEQQ